MRAILLFLTAAAASIGPAKSTPAPWLAKAAPGKAHEPVLGDPAVVAADAGLVGAALVADHQPLSGDVGSERLSADWTALRRLRAAGHVSAGGSAAVACV